jgi:hypothetical protein
MNSKKAHLACRVSEEHTSLVCENDVLRIILGNISREVFSNVSYCCFMPIKQ